MREMRGISPVTVICSRAGVASIHLFPEQIWSIKVKGSIAVT